jgi:hypothetical protein
VNALTNPEVGKFINENFVSAFQKVATFTIVNGQKQGGNVAAYFCAPDGRVLHTVAGPVDGATMLREARWVVEGVKKAAAESKSSGASFKALFRQWHAQRLRDEYGLIVEPVTFDAPQAQDDNDALSYRDPSGRALVPVLPPPPIEGPDVSLHLARLAAAPAAGDASEAAKKVSALNAVADKDGRRWQLGNQGRVHQLLAAHCMLKIEKLYGTVFESILGEKISTRPVVTINSAVSNRQEVCLHCAALRAQKDVEK